MAMAAGLFTIGCFGPLIAIYVRESLHASAGVFGIVSAMIGVGLLVGIAGDPRAGGASSTQRNAWCCRRPRGHRARRPHHGRADIYLPFTLLGTFVMGFAFAAIIVPAQTLMQHETPRELHGPDLEHRDVGRFLRADPRAGAVGRSRATDRRARRVPRSAPPWRERSRSPAGCTSARPCRRPPSRRASSRRPSWPARSWSRRLRHWREGRACCSPSRARRTG